MAPGITRERLEKEGQFDLNSKGMGSELRRAVPAVRQRKLPHAKWQSLCITKASKAQGLDPVASFVPPDESRHTRKAKAFPLELLARKADNFLNSTFSNLPSVQIDGGIGLLEMNPTDAEPRGIRDGDTVNVFNNRGEMHLKARVDGNVSPAWLPPSCTGQNLHPAIANINVLTSEKLTDLGNSATFYSVLVEVELFQAGLMRVTVSAECRRDLGRSPQLYRIIAVFHTPPV